MKCGVRISKSEFKNIIFYAIVNLISVIACEFAFASRKTMGITCVKDFVITYNYKIVPYMAMPVIMLLLISYFRRMYDDNIMVRYVNVRKFYLAVIAGGAVRIAAYVFITAIVVLTGGIISTHGIMNNWNEKNAMAQRVYGGYLTYTESVTVFAGVFITLIFIMFIIMELLLIIYRYVRSWIAGYFICMVVNLYMLIEQGNIRILRAYITYRVYQSGWEYRNLVYLVVLAAALLMVVLIMGKSDSLRRNR